MTANSLALTAGTFLACSSCSSTALHKPDDKVYRVGVSRSSQKAFLDETGQPAGLYVDVFRAAAAKSGLRYRFVWLDRRSADAALQNREVDVHLALTNTEARRRLGIYLAIPWWETPLMVVVAHDSAYKRVSDLAGRVVAVPGSAAGYWDQVFPPAVPGAYRLDTTPPDSPTDALCQGRADAVLAAGTDAEELLAVHPPGCRQYGFRFLRAGGQGLRYSVASLSTNRHVSDRITDAIREMAADGTLSRTVSPWLGLSSAPPSSLGGEIIARRRLQLTVAVAAVVLVAVISAFLGLMLWLQRRASNRVTEALGKAQRGEEVKSQFLATMSHEIRTPLNGVLGMTELMLGTQLTTEQRDAALTIKRSSAALLVILNDVLDLSRLEAGGVTVAAEPFNLRTLLDDVISLVAVRAAEKKLSLYMDVATDVPGRIEGDPGRLRQVLLNLLGNAVKFTGSGSVRLCAQLEDPVASGLCRLGFTVIDTGPGIPAEGLPLLFRKFSQLNGSASRNHGGAGLGLAISDSLVRALGGEISVHSRVGVGSSFSFDLPFRVLEEGAKPLAGRQVLISGPDSEQVRCLLQLARFAGAECPSPAPEVSVWVEQGGGGRIVRESAGATTVSPPSLVLAAPISYASLVAALGGVEQAPRTPPRVPIEGSCVLVAEDNPVNRKVVVSLLERLGCRVIQAHDGRQAIELWRAHRPTLILMDCQMPTLDGYEATRLIRAEEESKGVPRCGIWAVTANVMTEDREQCLRSGMDGVLAKPFTFEQLSQAVAAALGQPPLLAPPR